MRHCESHEEAVGRLHECGRVYPNTESVWYYFIGPWGKLKLTYAQYLFSPKLRLYLNSKDNYRLELGRRVYCFPKTELRDSPKLREAMVFLEQEKKANPLKFFMPNGLAGAEFLNDRSSTIKMIVAGNRYGKTCHGIIDMLLDIIPCKPDWPIFKENGVQYRPWNGKPQAWGVASYMWRHITTTVAPLIMDWTPVEYLGDYAPGVSGRRKIVSSDKRPYIEMTHGAKTQFFCYQQDQENFESAALNGWLWDEQGEEPKFDGADERTRTLEGRHIFALTPHKVEGRPDTGAGTWIHRMWKGEISKGHTVGRYSACTYDNPDWYYSEKQKRMAQIKHFKEPEKNNDEKALAEGRSRVHGEFHETSGLIYEDFQESIHVVDPFDIPAGWTRYRGVDHGQNVSQTAAVIAAVDPSNNIFVYDEFYQIVPNIYTGVQGIVKASGNRLHLMERRSDFGGNTEFDVYEEGRETCEFEWTKLDGRSFKYGDANTGRRLGDIYRDAGLEVTPARGADFTVRVPLVSEYFRVDYDLQHAVTKDKGAPKIYIFRNCRNLIDELKSYKWNDPKKTVSGEMERRPVKGHDHAVNALEFMLMSAPAFRGDLSAVEASNHFGKTISEEQVAEAYGERQQQTFINRITGY